MTAGPQTVTTAEFGGGVATSTADANGGSDATVQVSATSQGSGSPAAGASSLLTQYFEVIGPAGDVPVIVTATLTTTYSGPSLTGFAVDGQATASLVSNTLEIDSFTASSASNPIYAPYPAVINVDEQGVATANQIGSYTIDASVSAGAISVYSPAVNNDTVTASVDPTIAIDPSFANASEYRIVFGGNPACYCSGTLILTEHGERPVETLAIGDIVITAAGAARPVKWIGRRAYAGRFLAANPNVQPVRFQAGSLGGGLPRRDLRVSPEHAMFLDGCLVPSRCLVDDDAITRELGLDRVEYHHVELDSHDVILAEGAASESFLDDDSRGVFHNVREFATRYPDAEGPGCFCAPKVAEGYALQAIRRRLATQAERVARR